MELRHLRYFVAAAQEESFGRAAQRLRISGQALGLQIRDLEREIGFELFERIRQGVRLTSAGAAFLPRAREVLSGLERGIAFAQCVARGTSGVLRVGHVPDSMLRGAHVGRQLIREFYVRHPTVDIQAVQLTTFQQLKALGAGELDVAIAYAHPGHDSGLRNEILDDNFLTGAIIPADHPLARKTPLHCRDLGALPWLTSVPNTNPAAIDTFAHALRERGLDAYPDPKVRGTDPAVLISLVAVGAGWMLSPKMAGGVGAPGVVFREWVEAPIPFPCCMFWRDDDNSPVVLEVLCLARELRDGVSPRAPKASRVS